MLGKEAKIGLGVIGGLAVVLTVVLAVKLGGKGKESAQDSPKKPPTRQTRSGYGDTRPGLPPRHEMPPQVVTAKPAPTPNLPESDRIRLAARPNFGPTSGECVPPLPQSFLPATGPSPSPSSPSPSFSLPSTPPPKSPDPTAGPGRTGPKHHGRHDERRFGELPLTQGTDLPPLPPLPGATGDAPAQSPAGQGFQNGGFSGSGFSGGGFSARNTPPSSLSDARFKSLDRSPRTIPDVTDSPGYLSGGPGLPGGMSETRPGYDHRGERSRGKHGERRNTESDANEDNEFYEVAPISPKRTHSFDASPDSDSEAGSSWANDSLSGSGRSSDGTYRVEPNDSFWTISRRVYGTESYFKALAEFNRARVGGENHLAVGEVILTPEAADLQQRYPDLCPKPERRDTARRREALTNVSSGGTMLGGRTYKVESGDSLYSIARHELGDASRWPEIHRLNQSVLQGDYDYLTPGMTLTLPAGPATEPAGDRLARRRGNPTP